MPERAVLSCGVELAVHGPGPLAGATWSRFSAATISCTDGPGKLCVCEKRKETKNVTYCPCAFVSQRPGQPVGDVQVPQWGGSATTIVAQATRIAVRKVVPRIVSLRVVTPDETIPGFYR